MNESSRTIRWGIIGCGDVTERKSGPAYQKTEGFAIGAVMRRDEAKAKDYAQRHGIAKYCAKAEDLIADPEIDAVYIATPPDSHTEYALKVAAAGKPCCIEKPMAPTYRECVTIRDAFAKAQLRLFVAYYRRSLPRFTQIERWIRQGEIGSVRHIHWHLSKPASDLDRSQHRNWRTDAKIAVGGYFDDLASHGLDLFTSYLGDMASVKGATANQQKLYTAYDAVSACWIHRNGVTGTGIWNFGCREERDLVEIFGSEGRIECSMFQDVPIRLINAKGAQELFVEHPENVQLHFVESMRDDLFGKGQCPSTGSTGAHTGWVLSQILGID